MEKLIKSFKIYEPKKVLFRKNYFYEGNFYLEKWKKINNFNYLVSNYGRIKNATTLKLKQLKFQKYGMQVVLWKESKGYTITISKLVAHMFIRNLKKNERVFHINNDIRDNYYKNLIIKRK